MVQMPIILLLAKIWVAKICGFDHQDLWVCKSNPRHGGTGPEVSYIILVIHHFELMVLKALSCKVRLCLICPNGQMC